MKMMMLVAVVMRVASGRRIQRQLDDLGFVPVSSGSHAHGSTSPRATTAMEAATMDISAQTVKELRERTGAGFMDCKAALKENNGDMEAAVDFLRTKGLAKVAKKASRAANAGLVSAIAEGNKAVVVEVNAETDFVSRNEKFQEFVNTVTKLALGAEGDLEKLKAMDYPGTGRNVADELVNLISVIGENMNLRRIKEVDVSAGTSTVYMHLPLKGALGKLAVLVGLESTAPKESLEPLAKQLAMHVAATKPVAISQADLDQGFIERERQVQIKVAEESGKPKEIAEKMVEGKLRKYFEEICLLDQVFVIDNQRKVSDVLKDASKEFGAEVTLKDFALYVLGEGGEGDEKSE